MLESDLSALEKVMYRAPREAFDEYLGLKAQRDDLLEALTPSTETKAAYMGEFSFMDIVTDEDGEETTVLVPVPWTTIKEIMAAIRNRAATKEETE